MLDTTVDSVAVQSPVPGQTVSVELGKGDGIAVAGALALGSRFYLHGSYRSSIIDVRGRVESPLAVADVTGQFDLVTTTLGMGYQRQLHETFDVVAELSLETADYDFGSFAGENFDTDDSGIGARVGFRWNPQRAIEIFGGARYTPHGKALISERTFDSDVVLGAGLRWYFYRELAVGIDYEAGDVETLTIGMRFSFGNLQW